ncbi:ammonia channel protein [PVC group bacterium (ex Bugula neritina AB1)]|nr:ammonia channel protein [PVC group bacterium (ex Bugula neritina AB1)]
MNAGDTAWVMISTALVFIMIPGLGFFYGGLVRKKNFLSILMQCFMALGFMSLQWACLGYSLSFGTDIAGFIGGLDFLFLKNVDSLALPSTGIPHNLFMAFQGMFAIITPAIIIGAFAERIKFLSFCLFSLIWGTLVYDSLAHWVWGGGFLHKMGTLDFAGGTVVHINAGIAALILTIMIGKRKGYPKHISSPHNLPFAVLGAALLWFGWFGFNAGSALAANGIASNAFVTTQIAAATSGCIWALIEWIRDKHPTMLGSITGAVAGLAAITPAAGFVSPMNAIWIGIGAAIICYIFVTIIKPKLGYDDTLDAFGIHGIGGIWGAIATGLWASTEVNSAGANGFFYGNPELLWIQFKATAVTILYIVPVTWIIAKLIDKTVGLRTSESSERIGLDLSEHRETAYTTLD